MPDEILNTEEEIVVPPVPARKTGVTCEFCECKLTNSGEVLKLGECAKKYRKQEDRIEELQKEIDAKQKEIDALKASIPATPKQKKRDIFGKEV